jgi:hypothetical protein
MMKNETTALMTAAETALTYIVTDVTRCDGRKCREPHCASCYDAEDAAEAAQAGLAAYRALKDAIDAMKNI